MLLINPKRLTASRLDLASHCLWWARMDVDLPEDIATDYGEAGKMFHEAAANYLSHSDDEFEFQDDKVAHQFDGWVECWNELRIDAVEVEVPYAYDVSTGKVRQLPPEWWKKRDRTSTELVAVVDAVGLYGDVLVVADHKTGQRRGAAADSRQLMFGALCAAAVHGHDTVVAEYHYVDADGNIEVDSTVLTALELGALESELRAFVKEEEPHPRPGTHCSELFCKANEMNTCPATRENTEQLVPADRLPKGLTTDDDARAWILLLPAVKAATKKAEAALKKYVGDRQLELGDGRVYSRKEVTRTGYEVKPTSYMDYRIRGRKRK